jgi:hypothetical protein
VRVIGSLGGRQRTELARGPPRSKARSSFRRAPGSRARQSLQGASQEEAQRAPRRRPSRCANMCIRAPNPRSNVLDQGGSSKAHFRFELHGEHAMLPACIGERFALAFSSRGDRHARARADPLYLDARRLLGTRAGSRRPCFFQPSLSNQCVGFGSDGGGGAALLATMTLVFQPSNDRADDIGSTATAFGVFCPINSPCLRALQRT